MSVPVVRERWEVRAQVCRDYPYLAATGVETLTDAICVAERQNQAAWLFRVPVQPIPINPWLRLLAGL